MMNHQEQIERAYRSRMNRIFVWIVLAHIPFIPAVAAYFGTSLVVTTALAIAIAAGPALFYWVAPDSRMCSIAAAVALMGMGALLVHAGRGMIELHFHFFVSLALLIVMGNPWVLLASAAMIAVHHTVFWIWLPASVFNYQAGFGVVVVHALFVVAQVVPSCFIARTLGRFVTSVTAAVVTLRSSVDSVQTISADLSAENVSVARRAEAETERMRDTSATLQRMASEASSTSQQAAAVKRSADAARQAAERGAEQMREVGAAMASQQQASAQITQILRTIDGIAFQTNILALNAAVEAARAGEAGAGFAVVAGEVRDLAQRVAQAARDTSEKVEDAAQKSTRGAAIIQEAAATFDDIESQVRDVDTLMASLTEASNQQATTTSNVTTSISQMNEVVTASARSAVNAAHASQALAAEAAQLNESFEALGALLGDNRRVSASPSAATASRSSADASKLAA
jgi:hypothetical protein